MDVVWFAILGVLIAGYLALDGFSIGVGILQGRRRTGEAERRASVTAIGPFFLGSEVWLVAVGGVLFGAFPLLEGRLLAGLYPLIVVGLLVWMLRDASVWFRSRRRSPRWRRFWDASWTTMSVAFALFWGLVVGGLFTGLPHEGEVAAASRLVGPSSLLWAVIMVVLFAAHGAAFLAARLPAEPAADAEAIARRLLRPAAGALVFAVLVTVGFLIDVDVRRALPVVVIGVLGAGALWAADRSLAAAKQWLAPILSAFGVMSTILAAGSLLAPDVLSSAADSASLRVLGMFALVVLPVLAGLQTWMWRTFRHRVDTDTVVFF